MMIFPSQFALTQVFTKFHLIVEKSRVCKISKVLHSKMLRQSAKLRSSLTRLVQSRSYSCADQYKPEPPCKHHKDLVPPFSEVAKLKTFELKSDCTTFHLKSAGYDPRCVAPCPPPPCPPPCPEKKPPCPCPE